MKNALRYGISGVILTGSLLLFAGCKNDETTAPIKSAAPPSRPPAAVTPGGAQLPPGLTVNKTTGNIEGVKPVPKLMQSPPPGH